MTPNRNRALPHAWLKAAIAGLAVMAGSAGAATAAPCPALLDHRVPRLQDEKLQNLCQYAGKVVLVVNTASFCGYTPQYKSLETLYSRYRTRGLVVLGFPSNDFGGQEPGDASRIAEFCENTFGVKFPMFAKSNVARATPTSNPLYAQLRERSGVAPGWNFHKYVIAKDGTTVSSHSSDTDPLDRRFVQGLEKLLDAQ